MNKRYGRSAKPYVVILDSSIPPSLRGWVEQIAAFEYPEQLADLATGLIPIPPGVDPATARPTIITARLRGAAVETEWHFRGDPLVRG